MMKEKSASSTIEYASCMLLASINLRKRLLEAVATKRLLMLF